MRRFGAVALTGRVVVVGAVAAVVIGGVLGAPAVARTVDANAEPPSASVLTEATNAMLQPSDVQGVVAAIPSEDSGTNRFSTGYFNPPGGQDPLPVCTYGKGFNSVDVPISGVTGYTAATGAVTQNVYAYPSEAAANAAWRTVTSQIQSRCKGSFTKDGKTFSATASTIPGLGGVPGWGVNSRGAQAMYSALHFLGSEIQMVTVMSSVPAINVARADAANTLAATLAVRWLDRSNLAMTQDPFITQTTRTMLQPADMPTVLPIAQPASGSWSSLETSIPGWQPSSCYEDTQILAGAKSFFTALGSADVFPTPGAVSQSVYEYDSPALAQRAWNQLKTAQAKCPQKASKPIPVNATFDREVNGVSPLTFGGVPGIWSRELMISSDYGTDSGVGMSAKTYTINLLVGDAIQSVSYSRSVKGMQQVKLDQVAVNALAQELALRWVAGSD